MFLWNLYRLCAMGFILTVKKLYVNNNANAIQYALLLLFSTWRLICGNHV